MLSFFIFAQSIDCGYMLELPSLIEVVLNEAILTSTYNLCFRAKKKIQ